MFHCDRQTCFIYFIKQECIFASVTNMNVMPNVCGHLSLFQWCSGLSGVEELDRPEAPATKLEAQTSVDWCCICIKIHLH